MKNIKILIAFFALTFLSCSKLSDLNVDPDRSPDANPEQLITASQAYIGWIVDGNWNSLSAMWAQYVTWGPGVAIGNEERFISAATDFNNGWQNAYGEVLSNLSYVINNSDSEPHKAIAKIMSAYMYQGLVDNFGDVPFSEALKGQPEDGAIFAPKFDDDAAIYPQLVTMIDEGLSGLSGAGPEDIIYQGNVTKWTKFGNSLKLRILMRMSNVDPGVADQVRTLIGSGTFIESVADMAAIPYDGNSGTENPMFARYTAGVDNFYIASNSSLLYMQDSDDPRLNAIYAPAANAPTSTRGIAQGSIDSEPFTASVGDYSQHTALLYGADNDVILMSPWEVWFLRAEAAAKFGTADDDTEAFKNAISSHMAYLGVDDAAWIESLGYNSGLDLQSKLRLIGIQKWISFNGLQENEGWISARAFDTPENRMFTDATNGIWKKPALSVLGDGVFPNSWLIPQNEISFNPNAPTQKTIQDRVFWDN